MLDSSMIYLSYLFQEAAAQVDHEAAHDEVYILCLLTISLIIFPLVSIRKDETLYLSFCFADHA